VRRITPFLLVFALVIGTAGASFAQFYEEDATLWYIRGSFGAAGQDLSDVENAYQSLYSELASRGWDVSTSAFDFDQTWDYRFEVGAILWKGLGLGFCFNYQPRSETQTVSAIAPADQARLSDTIDINYFGYLASLSYWWPGTHSLFLGGTVGYGYGRFKSDATIQDPSNPQFSAGSSADYDGGNVVYGFNGGYQYKWVNGLLVYLQVGYEFRNLGTFTGTTTTTPGGPFDERSGDWPTQENPVDWDFSGPFLALGFGFTGPY